MENSLKQKIRYISLYTIPIFKLFKNLLPEDSGYEEKQYIKLGGVDKDTGRPVGVVVFSENENSVDLDYLYVDENYRFRGIGTYLLEMVQQYTLQVSRERGRLMKLACTFDTTGEEWFRFLYERHDMDIDFYGKIYKVSAKDLAQSATMKKILKRKNKDTGFKAAGPKTLKLLQKVINTLDPLMEFDVNDPGWSALSQVTIDKNGTYGFLLVHVIDNENVEVEYMDYNGSDSFVLPNMIANAFGQFVKDYPKATVHFTIMDDVFGNKNGFMDQYPIGYMGVATWNYLPNLSYEQIKSMKI